MQREKSIDCQFSRLSFCLVRIEWNDDMRRTVSHIICTDDVKVTFKSPPRRVLDSRVGVFVTRSRLARFNNLSILSICLFP